MTSEGLNVPMARTSECSRRTAPFAASLPLAWLCCAPKIDVGLSALWSEFVQLAAKLNSDDSNFGDLDRLERLFDKICSTRADTIDGLCVKARVGCWSLMGDFDSASKSVPGAQIAFSIMQDLIRAYHPELERAGAVQKLLGEIEQDSR